MANALYTPKGVWSKAVNYNYLDEVQYARVFYVCVSISSLGEQPDISQSWVAIPTISTQDELYLKSREDLLYFEDNRFNSLLKGVANFYSIANDQSLWGNFLRAVAMELARLDYLYQYDIINKQPKYMTPTDIRRKYADVLFIDKTYPQRDQFDLGDFSGTSSAPTAPVGYRDMLIDLLAAYHKGATPAAIEAVIYAYTGKTITVEELYTQIGLPGSIYDQSDRNSVKVSVNVGGDDPLTDIQNLQQLQDITESLYGAIDLTKPAHVGLEFTTVFGTGESADQLISPRYLSQYQLNTLTVAQQTYYALITYVLKVSPFSGWVKGVAVPLSVTLPVIGTVPTLIQDSNGNIQMAVVPGNSGATLPEWSTELQGVTVDGTVQWANIGTAQISIAAYSALTPAQQALYQGYYYNSSGIDDTLRVIIQQFEEPPFDPMLWQAPIINIAHPTTTLAAYGVKLQNNITAMQWQQLQSSPAPWDATVTYKRGALTRGLTYMVSQGSGTMGTMTDTISWIMYRATKKNVGQNPVTDGAGIYWKPISSPSAYQAYYWNGNAYSLGIQKWAPETVFYAGQYVSDPNGNLQIALAGGTSGSSTTVLGVSVTDVSLATGVPLGTLTVMVPSTVGLPIVGTGQTASVTFYDLTNATFLNGQTLAITSLTPTSIVINNFQHLAYTATSDTGNVQAGFAATGKTNDGGVEWQCVTSGLTDPSKWIGITDNGVMTGEVSNWDAAHPYGLLAPRQDLVWEVSGDTFNGYEYD